MKCKELSNIVVLHLVAISVLVVNVFEITGFSLPIAYPCLCNSLIWDKIFHRITNAIHGSLPFLKEWSITSKQNKITDPVEVKNSRSSVRSMLTQVSTIQSENIQRYVSTILNILLFCFCITDISFSIWLPRWVYLKVKQRNKCI